MTEIVCPFCEELSHVFSDEFVFARFDKYPVNQGHLLIIPHRHFSDYFAATPDEINAIQEALQKGKSLLDAKYSPDGYNIGINCGEAAGQTVMHMHVHLIPRFKGDVENPAGGVRGVIPSKQKYRNE